MVNGQKKEREDDVCNTIKIEQIAFHLFHGNVRQPTKLPRNKFTIIILNTNKN